MAAGSASITLNLCRFLFSIGKTLDKLRSSLSFFAASSYSTVLEDAVTALRCLDELNTELRIIKTKVDMNVLLAQKYGVEQPPVTDELEGLDPKNLHLEEYKLVKLANDRIMVCGTLLQLYKELSLKWKFTSLHDHVEKTRMLGAYRDKQETDRAKLKLTCKELSKQIRHQRNTIKSTYYDTDDVIESLKTHVEDLQLEQACRNRYIVSWQNARQEQLIEKIDFKESQPTQSILTYTKKLEDETRVHAEIEMLGLITMNEKAEKVERWMEKYDVDIEAVDLKIQIQKNNYNVAHDRRQDLERIIQTHEELITNWLKFKSEREAKRQYEEKMNRAAVMLQAWWRGLLVRKALGPYRVKGRPGAKKGKKKKE